MTTKVNPQKAHYEKLHNVYEAHYYDPTSMWYREREIYNRLFMGLDLNGWRIADLACGSGHNSLAVKRRYPQAELVGFDISEDACRAYRNNTGAPDHQCDLTRPMSVDTAFDAAIIIGGLHHCVLDLRQALANIASIVRNGGYLLMFEPNDDFVLSVVRKVWYQKDDYFESSSERALRHDEILVLSGESFELERVRYLGGPAYFFILNSLVTRVPLSAKRYIAPAMMAGEWLYNRLPGRWLFPTFTAIWRRTRYEETYYDTG